MATQHQIALHHQIRVHERGGDMLRGNHDGDAGVLELCVPRLAVNVDLLRDVEVRTHQPEQLMQRFVGVPPKTRLWAAAWCRGDE